MIYEPAEDSYLLEKEIRKYSKGKSFLDIGSGSGILVESAKEAGASSILASDINPESIILLKEKGIPAVISDLFSNIQGTFDIIAFNPPYLPEDESGLEDDESETITTGGKKGDEIIIRFLKEARKHLSPGGIILTVLSSLTPKNRILSLLKSKKLSFQILSHQKLFMETIEVWKIQKA